MKNYFDTLTKHYEDIIIEINNEFQKMFNERIKNKKITLKPLFLFNREVINAFDSYKSSHNLKFEVTNNENETNFKNLSSEKGLQLHTLAFAYSLSESSLTTEIKTISFINKIPKKNIRIEFLFSIESSTITVINNKNEYAYLSFNHINNSIYLYPNTRTIESEYFNIIKNISKIDIDTAMEVVFEKKNLSKEEKESFYLIHDLKLTPLDYNLIFDINNVKAPLTTKQLLNKNKKK